MQRLALRRLRAICRALPESQELETWGQATFRVRHKIFCMHVGGTHGSGVWCKAPPGSQAILVGADPRRFFVPPYVGHRGWIGMRLDESVDWSEVAKLLERSYRLTAPKKLAARLNPSSPVPTDKNQGRRL
jgi:predicted DNA-binding protein (MmcQ/YjbR family)